MDVNDPIMEYPRVKASTAAHLPHLERSIAALGSARGQPYPDVD
jgi:hypothetical protein